MTENEKIEKMKFIQQKIKENYLNNFCEEYYLNLRKNNIPFRILKNEEILDVFFKNHNKKELYNEYIKKSGIRIKQKEFDNILCSMIKTWLSNKFKEKEDIDIVKNNDIKMEKDILDNRCKQLQKQNMNKTSFLNKILNWWNDLYFVQWLKSRKLEEEINNIIFISKNQKTIFENNNSFPKQRNEFKDMIQWNFKKNVKL